MSRWLLYSLLKFCFNLCVCVMWCMCVCTHERVCACVCGIMHVTWYTCEGQRTTCQSQVSPSSKCVFGC